MLESGCFWDLGLSIGRKGGKAQGLGQCRAMVQTCPVIPEFPSSAEKEGAKT